MGEAPILDYCKPQPPPIGWRGELFSAFAVGTVVGCVVAGAIALVVDMLVWRGKPDICPFVGSMISVGIVLGVFGGSILVAAAEVRRRMLKRPVEPRDGKSAIWAGIIYPAPLTVFFAVLLWFEVGLNVRAAVMITLMLAGTYPIIAAQILMRPWGELIASGKPPAPVPVIEIEPPDDEADERKS